MVDFKDINNKDDFLKFKNTQIQEIDNFINDLTNSDYKKAVNLTYWIKDYKNYLKAEKTFDSKYLPAYPYGKIVEVNLGFRLGSEHGGLHYGIVINKKDNKSNPNLTIIPLSSSKGKNKNQIHWSEVYLGNEFYNLFTTKINTLSTEFYNQGKKLSSEIETFQKELTDIAESDLNSPETIARFDLAEKQIKILRKKKTDIDQKLDELRNCHNKIKKLKTGSIALVSQVLTISKIRIKDPLRSNDPLSDIIISSDSMEKIEEKFKSIYF